ncbi:MAG: ATP-binding protein, partial [Leptospiraceae bacterium]|nr:ATP-binding protein [Leptospiraceae bacterium]
KAILIGLPLMLSLFSCGESPQASFEIDLNQHTAFVREGLHGLDEPGVASIPSETTWKVIPPARSPAGRPIRIHTLDLSGVPHRSFPQWTDSPSRDFTIKTCFDVSESLLSQMHSPTLQMAHIGEEWRIFLNGHLMAASPSNGNGFSRRDYITPLDVRRFQPGLNCLLFAIRGDPLNMETGLYYGAPYRIADSTSVNRETSEALSLSLIGIYLAIGLFHILFFLQKKEDRYNVYFGFFSALMAFWLFSRTATIYTIVPEYYINLRLELGSVFLLLPVFASFIQAAQGGVHRWFLKSIWGFHLVLLGILFLPSINLIQDLLVIWRVMAIFFLLYFLLAIPLRYWRYVRLFRVRHGQLKAMQQALFNTVPGNILVGTIVVALTGLVDILNASQGKGHEGITGYAFLIFVGGSALRIANRLLFLNDTVENLNRKLRHNLAELNRTNSRLSASERRYRHLIDGSRDIILSIDSGGIIRLASRATRSELGLGPEELEGKHVESLIHGDPADQFRTLEFFRERFDVFQKEKESLQMKIPVRTRESQAAQFQLTLQKMQGEKDWEILGRLVPLKEDYLLQFLQKEQLTFSLGNELIAVEELSQRLVRNIPRYVDKGQAAMIRIGLREILINAIEHGNLSITYEEKSQELASGNYSEFISLRQADPRFRQRTVTIDYNLDVNGVVYRIQDQGSGFDHGDLEKKTSTPPDGELPLHGRGIMITRNAFDLVEYNEKGNEVRLLKYFR